MLDLVTWYCNVHSCSASVDPSAPSHPNPVVLLSREAENLDMTLAPIPLIATHPKEACKLSLAREKLSRSLPPVSAKHLAVYLVSVPITYEMPSNTHTLSSLSREALEDL